MPAYDVMFEAASQQLAAQLATADAVAAKTATIFTLASAVSAVVPALLPIGKPSANFHSLTFGLLVAAIGAYVLTFAGFFAGYGAGTWAAGPRPDELEDVGRTYSSDEVRAWVALTYLLSIRRNDPVLRAKISWFNRIFATFVLEVGLLIAAGIATFAR
jgi:hypothetical protein